ncbi:ABC transporter permease [Longispora sp. K20-0274]|uniref:ABC transporter permease n=1 Tax=Longispora sp. K20-0274 TaxID=3088255 RepID=UPI00399BA152
MTTVTDGRAAGWLASRTLRYPVEFRRQLTRRRTKMALGFLALLPLLLAGAFKLNPGGNGSGSSRQNAYGSLVDLATGSALNFTIFSLFVSSTFLLIVVVALFCGDTIASEASWGSLRYLLAVPVPRSRLLAVKLSVALTYCAIAVLLLSGSAMLFGWIFFGWHDLGTPLGGVLPAGTGTGRVLGVVAYLAIQLLPIAGLAFLLSVSTDAPLGAVGGAVLLQIIANILDAVTALGDLRNFLPGHYDTGWLGLLASPMQTEDMIRGTISALLYVTVFVALGWWRFLRKDVVS